MFGSQSTFVLEDVYCLPEFDPFVLLEFDGELGRVIYRREASPRGSLDSDVSINDLGWVPAWNAVVIATACAARLGLREIPYRHVT